MSSAPNVANTLSNAATALGPPATPAANGRDHEVARAWSVLLDELRRIRTLPDDWDGEGTPAPAAGVVARAVALAGQWQAARWRPADRVLAGLNGTVLFEWHTPNGYGEAEVLSATEAELRWLPAGATTAEVAPL